MRHPSEAEGRWKGAADWCSGDAPVAAPAVGHQADGAAASNADPSAGRLETPSSRFQVPDGNGRRDARSSAVFAFPPHASLAGSGNGGGGNGGNRASGPDGGASTHGGPHVLRDAATAEATEAKADAMQSAAGTALGAVIPKHARHWPGGAVAGSTQARTHLPCSIRCAVHCSSNRSGSWWFMAAPPQGCWHGCRTYQPCCGVCFTTCVWIRSARHDSWH